MFAAASRLSVTPGEPHAHDPTLHRLAAKDDVKVDRQGVDRSGDPGAFGGF
jgi:hypothetical protein